MNFPTTPRDTFPPVQANLSSQTSNQQQASASSISHQGEHHAASAQDKAAEGRALAGRDRARLGLGFSTETAGLSHLIASTFARASLSRLAHSILPQLIREHGSEFLKQFPRAQDGSFLDPRPLAAHLKQMAYHLYSNSHLVVQNGTFSDEEQAQYVQDIGGLAEEFGCKIRAQAQVDNPNVQGKSPHEALEIDAQQAKATQYYLYPTDFDKRKPPRDSSGVARIALNVGKSDLIPVARKVLALFPSTSDILWHVKLASATKVGVRIDPMLLYLNKANLEKAVKLAAQLQAEVNPEVWIHNPPCRTLPLGPGVAYAEIPGAIKDISLGEGIANLMSELLIMHLEIHVPIDEALDDALEEDGYDQGNPALLA